MRIFFLLLLIGNGTQRVRAATTWRRGWILNGCLGYWRREWSSILATWQLVTPSVTGIYIYDTIVNHLVNLMFVRPGERSWERRTATSIWPLRGNARTWTLFWMQFKRRLTGRVNLASLMHYQPHDYIIDYLRVRVLRKSTFVRYCPVVFTSCIDKIAKRIYACERFSLVLLSLFGIPSLISSARSSSSSK